MKFALTSTNHKKRILAESKLGFFKFWESINCKNKASKLNKKILSKMTHSHPKSKKSLIDSILGDLSKSSAVKQIILGTASGWLTGFITMKAGKIAAVAVGGGILILQIAQHKGYIHINWEKIYSSADKMIDKIEEQATGKGPDAMDKITRYVDRKLDKAEDLLKSNEKKARKWYHSLFNNNYQGGYELQELHLFMASFAAGVTFGFATA